MKGYDLREKLLYVKVVLQNVVEHDPVLGSGSCSALQAVQDVFDRLLNTPNRGPLAPNLVRLLLSQVCPGQLLEGSGKEH